MSNEVSQECGNGGALGTQCPAGDVSVAPVIATPLSPRDAVLPNDAPLQLELAGSGRPVPAAISALLFALDFLLWSFTHAAARDAASQLE